MNFYLFFFEKNIASLETQICSISQKNGQWDSSSLEVICNGKIYDIDKEKIYLPKWSLSSYEEGEKTVFSIKQDQAMNTIDWIRKEIAASRILNYSISETTLEDIYVSLTEEGGRKI